MSGGVRSCDLGPIQWTMILSQSILLQSGHSRMCRHHRQCEEEIHLVGKLLLQEIEAQHIPVTYPGMLFQLAWSLRKKRDWCCLHDLTPNTTFLRISFIYNMQIFELPEVQLWLFTLPDTWNAACLKSTASQGMYHPHQFWPSLFLQTFFMPSCPS